MPRDCGGLLEPATDKIHTFASPNWPGGYDRNIHCEWVVRNRDTTKKAIVVQFNQFQLQNSSDCKPDNVVMYDGMLHCSDYLFLGYWMSLSEESEIDAKIKELYII